MTRITKTKDREVTVSIGERDVIVKERNLNALEGAWSTRGLYLTREELAAIVAAVEQRNG